MSQCLNPLLVPLQHRACEDEAQGNCQQPYPHQPVCFPRAFVTAGGEHPDQVQDGRHHHQVGGPEVEAADEVAKRHPGDDIKHTVVGVGRVGMVKLGQQHPGDDEDDEPEEGDPTQQVGQAVGVLRHRVGQHGEAQPLVQLTPKVCFLSGRLPRGLHVGFNCHSGTSS